MNAADPVHVAANALLRTLSIHGGHQAGDRYVVHLTKAELEPAFQDLEDALGVVHSTERRERAA